MEVAGSNPYPEASRRRPLHARPLLGSRAVVRAKRQDNGEASPNGIRHTSTREIGSRLACYDPAPSRRFAPRTNARLETDAGGAEVERDPVSGLVLPASRTVRRTVKPNMEVVTCRLVELARRANKARRSAPCRRERPFVPSVRPGMRRKGRCFPRRRRPNHSHASGHHLLYLARRCASRSALGLGLGLSGPFQRGLTLSILTTAVTTASLTEMGTSRRQRTRAFPRARIAGEQIAWRGIERLRGKRTRVQPTATARSFHQESEILRLVGIGVYDLPPGRRSRGHRPRSNFIGVSPGLALLLSSFTAKARDQGDAFAVLSVARGEGFVSTAGERGKASPGFPVSEAPGRESRRRRVRG